MSLGSKRLLPTVIDKSPSKASSIISSEPRSIADKFRAIGQSLELASSISTEEKNFSKKRPSSVEQNRDFRQNPIDLLKRTQNIRENVTEYKNQLIRHDFDPQRIFRRSTTKSSSSLSRHFDDDRTPTETDSYVDQDPISIKDKFQWKKALDQSERQRQQLTEDFQNLLNKFDEKEKILLQLTSENKDLTENCDTFERQNHKLQQDLRLALGKLEEMTNEAEQFADECQETQKKLADFEQKHDKYQIETQEILKQWANRVKKLEKDLERQNLESTQLLEKNSAANSEISTLKSQNLALREKLSECESEMNQNKIDSQQFEEEFRENQNELNQLRTIRSTNENEIVKLKGILQEFESHLAKYRQRCSQLERDKIQRESLQSQFEQIQIRCENLQTSNSKLEENLRQFNNERTDLAKKLREFEEKNEILTKTLDEEREKFFQLETNGDQLKKKFERFQIDSERQLKTIQIEYENQLEKLRFQLVDEKSRTNFLQRNEIERKKDLDKFRQLQNDSFEDKSTIERLILENEEKSQLISNFQSKLTKMTSELSNEKIANHKKDKDFQNFSQMIFDDLNVCIDCLSTNGDQEFDHDENDDNSLENRIKIRFAWLKQEISLREEKHCELRRDLDRLLLDSEVDRKYFATELAKRQILLNDFNSNEIFSNSSLNIAEKSKENNGDSIDQEFHEFRTMIDSIKRDLQTAKLRLFTSYE